MQITISSNVEKRLLAIQAGIHGFISIEQLTEMAVHVGLDAMEKNFIKSFEIFMASKLPDVIVPKDPPVKRTRAPRSAAEIPVSTPSTAPISVLPNAISGYPAAPVMNKF